MLFLQSFTETDLNELLYLEPRDATTNLGSVALVHSKYRLSLIRQRDQLIESLAERHQAAKGPIVREGDNIRFAARPTSVRWAVKSPDENGRNTVMVALGSLDELDLIALTVPDAHRLKQSLELALSVSTLPASR